MQYFNDHDPFSQSNNFAIFFSFIQTLQPFFMTLTWLFTLRWLWHLLPQLQHLAPFLINCTSYSHQTWHTLPPCHGYHFMSNDLFIFFNTDLAPFLVNHVTYSHQMWHSLLPNRDLVLWYRYVTDQPVMVQDDFVILVFIMLSGTSRCDTASAKFLFLTTINIHFCAEIRNILPDKALFSTEKKYWYFS